MICCCALAGTTACKNCNRRAEFEYSQKYLENRSYIVGTEERVMELLNAIKRLNERIDEILGGKNEETDIKKEANSF